jgi:sec-independent protein translocase protein TatA
MGSMSIVHWMIVIAVIVLLFGRGKISGLMADVADGIKSFKKGMQEDEHASSTVAPPEPLAEPKALPPKQVSKKHASTSDLRFLCCVPSNGTCGTFSVGSTIKLQKFLQRPVSATVPRITQFPRHRRDTTGQTRIRSAFLVKVGTGKTVSQIRKNQVVFSQGQAADCAYYLQRGQDQAYGYFRAGQGSGRWNHRTGTIFRRRLSHRPTGAHLHGTDARLRGYVD